MKKTIIIALCLVIALSAFAGCGGSSASYRDDVAVDELASAVETAIGGGSMSKAPETYASTWKLDLSACSEYIMKLNSTGVNIDEYGIFKAKDSGSVSAVKTALENYLKSRRDAWMSEYMPEEYPKLENAEVKAVGSYVMYAILDDAGRSTAFAALESALKK